MNNNRTNLDEYHDLLTIDELCEYLRISTKTGYKLISGNKIKYIKIGKSFRIPKDYLLEFLQTG